MLDVTDEVDALLRQNRARLVELMLLRRKGEEPFFLRTNAPFDIDWQGRTYKSGGYPVARVSVQEKTSASQRNLMQIELLDQGWGFRAEARQNGYTGLRIEMALAIFGDEPVAKQMLGFYRGKSVSARSAVSDAQGPVFDCQFSGPIDKVSAQSVRVVSEDSERQVDPSGTSFAHAHNDREFRWNY